MWHWDFLTSSFGVNPITKGEAEAWGCGINGWRVSTGLNTELKSISARTNTTATTACSTGPAHHQYINTLIWCLHNTSAFKFDWTTKIIVYEEVEEVYQEVEPPGNSTGMFVLPGYFPHTQSHHCWNTSLLLHRFCILSLLDTVYFHGRLCCSDTLVWLKDVKVSVNGCSSQYVTPSADFHNLFWATVHILQ